VLLEQIMTCHFIPGGHLLSPLTGNVLELRQKPKAVIKHEAPEFHDGKAELHRGRGQTASATLDIKDKNAKEVKYDEKEDRVPKFKSSKCRVNKPSTVNKGTMPHVQDVSDDTGSLQSQRQNIQLRRLKNLLVGFQIKCRDQRRVH